MEREYKPKPIDKEYLKNTLKDFDSDVLSKKYLQSDDEHTHDNKETLDKLSTSNDGRLLFDGNEISHATAGKSAYEIAQDNGFQGSESEWLDSLKGNDGINGADGANGVDGTNGTDGIDGKSAYEIAVQNGFEGSEQQWLESLKGKDGINGIDGKSAYEIATQNGFVGTEQEWIDSLNADQVDAYTKTESNNKFVTASQIWTGTNQFKFGVDADGNYGYYKVGADTVTPFKTGSNIVVPDNMFINTSNNIQLNINASNLMNENSLVGSFIVNRESLVYYSTEISPQVMAIEMPILFQGTARGNYTNVYRNYFTEVTATIINESTLQDSQKSNVEIINTPILRIASEASNGWVYPSYWTDNSFPIIRVTFPNIDYTHDVEIALSLTKQLFSSGVTMQGLRLVIYKPKVVL